MSGDAARTGSRVARLLAGPIALVSALAALAGCSHPAAPVSTLPGDRVARMVEDHLERDHPGTSPGTLECPDLAFTVGATARCVRTARLSRGRLVRVLGTVRVMSVAGGGDLRLKLDDGAVEFGLDGGYLADRLRTRISELGRAVPTAASCPYLVGRVGAEVTCSVGFVTGRRRVRIAVSAVAPETYDVAWTTDPRALAVG